MERKRIRIAGKFRQLTLLFIAIGASALTQMTLAQSKRPQVLIYGDGIDAYTAAIQSAKSKLNTFWVWQQSTLEETMALTAGVIQTRQKMDGGIWADLLAATMGSDRRSDSISALAKSPLNPRLIYNAMEKEISRHPNLTIVRGMRVRTAKRNKRNWKIQLENRQTYRVRSVVDASLGGDIGRMAGLPKPVPMVPIPEDYLESSSFLDLMRTGVAVSDLGADRVYSLPLGSLIPAGGNNLFFTKLPETMAGARLDAVLSTTQKNDLQHLPFEAHLGQAVGAAAAYVAFYRSSSENVETRQIQGELLQYGARLLPHHDISIEDPHFLAIQRVGLTGLFRSPSEDPGRPLFFRPDAHVSTDELRPTLNLLYSRSQVWFTDHRSPKMTVSELISLIKYIAHRGDELENVIEKQWGRTLNLPGVYDPDQYVTRRQVAVLLDAFCRPFDVRVDLQGKITR